MGWQIVYSGVGKVNAAITLCDALSNLKLWKCGGAAEGFIRPVPCNTFLQRDMDVRALGFSLGQTPFEDDVIIDLDGDGLSCGTGDNFVSAPPEMSWLTWKPMHWLKSVSRKPLNFTVLNLSQIMPMVTRLMIGFSSLSVGARLFSESSDET